MNSPAIEIITTPNQGLKETGFGSLKACEDLAGALTDLGHRAILNICRSAQELNLILLKKPGLVVPAVKYIPGDGGENTWLTRSLEDSKINFTGSGRGTLNYDSDKLLAKRYLQENGIATAEYFSVLPGQFSSAADLPLGFPLFLKPADAANGSGIDEKSYVTSFDEFQAKAGQLYDLYKVPVLAEEFLDGPEYTAAVIEDSTGELHISPIEILAPPDGSGISFLGEQIKKDSLDELRAVKDKDIRRRIIEMAAGVFRVLGVRDYGRIDLRSDRNGKLHCIEANLVPGMENGFSYFPEAFRLDRQMDYREIVRLLTSAGISRTGS